VLTRFGEECYCCGLLKRRERGEGGKKIYISDACVQYGNTMRKLR
jgi:hypothetical protein